MSRYTAPDHRLPTAARERDIWIVMASHMAVTRAMEHAHDDNPAGFHQRRPTMTHCPYDSGCPFLH